MLKTVYLNHKKTPVPIPIKNLLQATRWIEEFLVKEGYSMTKLTLDGQEIDVFEGSVENIEAMALSEESRLEVQIESVKDISIQTIDALRNLCVILEKSLKPLAVSCWKHGEQRGQEPQDVEAALEDLILILDLIDHVRMLIQDSISLDRIIVLYEQMASYRTDLQKQIAAKEWKDIARTLLQRIEPVLPQLAGELQSLQSLVYDQFSDRKWSKLG